MTAKTRAGIVLGICTALFLGLFILIGPLDFFSHGYFCDEPDIDNIYDKESLEFSGAPLEIWFVPQKKHFEGIEIYLSKSMPEMSGTLDLRIYDDEGKLADSTRIWMSEVKEHAWYKSYIGSSLKKGKLYDLILEYHGDDEGRPIFYTADKGSMPPETQSGNILLGYAYRNSTFSFQEKVLIGLFLLGFWGIACWLVTPDNKKSIILTVSILLMLVSLAAWNYMFNSLNACNTEFEKFQLDSEGLVTGVIQAEREGIKFTGDNIPDYGLGYYYDLKGPGPLGAYGKEYRTDDEWLDGYNRSLPEIMVNSNDITKDIAVEGNRIEFKSGDVYEISRISDDNDNIIITLDTESRLSKARLGSLDEAVFYDQTQEKLDKSYIIAYQSQYGLHGKVFSALASCMTTESIETIKEYLNLICSVLTALVFVGISYLLCIKYNKLYGLCFYMVYLLSPWTVNYARNLYWVEFTWFAPMAVGLFCSIKINNVKFRVTGYILGFLTIFLKCLCGYEYLTTVMLGLISFPLIDILVSFAEKEIKKALLMLKTAFILGCTALAGFGASICIHAYMRGNGDIAGGIRSIIMYDVLRRVNGANLNNFDTSLWESMNASIWETFCRYFHFSSDIVSGIPGELFPMLCIIPFGIFLYDMIKRNIDYTDMFSYLVFFLTSISWMCLAKNHAFYHPHLIFVLWYFGFIQVCFYILVKRLLRFTRSYVERTDRTY